MKIPLTLAILALVAGVATAGETVDWKTDLPAALEAAKEDGKPVLALFWAEW